MSPAHPSLVACVLLAFTLPASAAEYEFSWALPRPQGNALHGLAFESASTGVAVGVKGATIHTTDGGATWTNLGDFGAFPTTLNDVLALGGGSYLAVGEAPGIFRSDNGGASWNAVPNPSTETLDDVDVVSGSTLAAVGESGQVVRSTDGGATWALRPSAGAKPLREQRWLDASTGFVVGDQIARRTTDGGATWLPLAGVNETQDFFAEITVATPSVLYAFASFHYAKSTDGGATWAWNFAPVFPVYRGKSVAFDAEHLMVVTNIEGAEIWESFDGADTWSPLLQRFDLGGFTEFRRLTDGTLVAISTEGDVIRSTDGGANWSNATHTPDDEPRVTISTFAVLPNGRAFAGSTPPGAAVFRWHRSDDGGSTWYEPATGPGLPDIADLAFWDDVHGLASGFPNSVSFTTDGGETWSAAALPNAISNGVRAYRLALPASGVAFCAADGTNGALVFRTTDFGATWAQRSSGIPVNTPWVGSVSFLDASTGFAAGGSTNLPRIWKTTDGGGSWTLVSTTGIPNFISDVHWFNAQTGLVALNSATPGVYRTTNGGTSWSPVLDPQVLRFSFLGQRGYARPGTWQFGELFGTQDGGATWETIDLPADRGGTAVLALPNGFLAGGSQSQIVCATDLSFTGIASLPASAADDRSAWLRAAPSVGRAVTLSWAIRNGGSYRVDVFDVAGRRVRSLASGRVRSAETGSIAWEGRTDAGGVAAAGTYFARLLSGDHVRAVSIHLVR